MAETQTSEGAPSAKDWALLLSIVIMGGSSFALIRLAIDAAPPVWVGAIRLWIAAGLLYVLMRASGRRLPPFFIKDKDGDWRMEPKWRSMSAVGVVGGALPFMLIPWAQQYIDSSLAGIYMAVMPLSTVGLAYIFADETISLRKAAGFCLGFVGILILMGPSALAQAGRGNFLAEAAILCAANLYAIASIITRRAPEMSARSFAAGSILVGAVFATPPVIWVSPPTDFSFSSGAAIVALGLFPSGLASISIISLVRSAGPGFMSLSNYLTPLWAVALGIIFFTESLSSNAVIALAVIFSGLLISQTPRNLLSTFVKKFKGRERPPPKP
ncbi:MAG: EamA family transporter [Pseudomonadota bacterium]